MFHFERTFGHHLSWLSFIFHCLILSPILSYPTLSLLICVVISFPLPLSVFIDFFRLLRHVSHFLSRPLLSNEEIEFFFLFYCCFLLRKYRNNLIHRSSFSHFTFLFFSGFFSRLLSSFSYHHFLSSFFITFLKISYARFLHFFSVYFFLSSLIFPLGAPYATKKRAYVKLIR